MSVNNTVLSTGYVYDAFISRKTIHRFSLGYDSFIPAELSTRAKIGRDDNKTKLFCEPESACC